METERISSFFKGLDNHERTQKTVFQYIMADSLDEGSKPAEFYASVFGKDSIQIIERTYPTPQTGRDAHPAESLGSGAGEKDSTEVKPNAQSTTAKQITKEEVEAIREEFVVVAHHDYEGVRTTLAIE